MNLKYEEELDFMNELWEELRGDPAHTILRAHHGELVVLPANIRYFISDTIEFVGTILVNYDGSGKMVWHDEDLRKYFHRYRQ